MAAFANLVTCVCVKDESTGHVHQYLYHGRSTFSKTSMLSMQSLLSKFKSFGAKAAADEPVLGSLGWEVCNSPRYEHHLHIAQQEFASLGGVELRMPANHRTLIFGHSYVRLIVDNIIVASDDVLTRMRGCRAENVPNFYQEDCSRASTPYIASCSSYFNTSRRDWGKSTATREGDGDRFDPTLLSFDPINSSMLFVHNHAPLHMQTKPGAFPSGEWAVR